MKKKVTPRGRVPEAADVHFMPLEGPARLDLTARPVRDRSIGRRFLTEAGLNMAFTKTLTARIAPYIQALFHINSSYKIGRRSTKARATLFTPAQAQ
jgi:hypothetical protein